VFPRTWTLVVVAALALVITASAGPLGWAYSIVYVGALVPGWPIGWALAGRRHPGAWIIGSLLGYGLSAVAICIPMALGRPVWWAFVLSWAVVTSLSFVVARRVASPVIRLPIWRRSATAGLATVLLLASLIVSVPYARIGEHDELGQARYRAYFTADFVWHEALTAEVARGEMPPRNPYRAREKLAYYWTYFLLPAAATSIYPSPGPPAPIEALLKVNGIWTAHLFVSVIFLAAWVLVPRGFVAACATGLTLMATSPEGLYAAVQSWRNTGSLASLKELNIDAITMWWFEGMTIDGLPRSIWYNPQHSMAVSLGLSAMIIASRFRGERSVAVGAITGLCLGLALLMSPFPGGVMAIIVAATFAWRLIVAPQSWRAYTGVAVSAAVPMAAALWWCLASGMVEGAGGALAVGTSARAMTSPGTVLALAIGPVLLFALLGIVAAVRSGALTRLRGSFIGVGVALGLYFLVTLELEPIWIGWRAGQVLLVTAPGLLAWSLLAVRRRAPRWVLGLALTLWAVVGLPTTVIDWYNAQDTSNVEMGAGFRWTVVLTPAELAAFEWIQQRTPPDAVVQAAPGPRGRETWSLIPSFARRRMAQGLPISLLVTDEVQDAAARIDKVFSGPDPEAAWATAREEGVNFLFVGRVEREAFPGAAEKFVARPDLFLPVFSNPDAAIYEVRAVSGPIRRP
jgi:hypothetical protein